MKKVVCLLTGFVMLASINVVAQGSLEITIRNLRNDNGNVRVGIFREDNFLKKAVFGEVQKAANGTVVVVFDDLPAGEYALSVIHDENANEDLDSNALGIPKEGFAFGNNAMGFFGPPSFDNAKFRIDHGKRAKQVIDIRYL